MTQQSFLFRTFCRYLDESHNGSKCETKDGEGGLWTSRNTGKASKVIFVVRIDAHFSLRAIKEYSRSLQVPDDAMQSDQVVKDGVIPGQTIDEEEAWKKDTLGRCNYNAMTAAYPFAK